MVGNEGPKIFEFNTSTLLEKKRHLRHYPVFLSFLLFIFFVRQYCICNIEILLDMSLNLAILGKIKGMDVN